MKKSIVIILILFFISILSYQTYNGQVDNNKNTKEPLKEEITKKVVAKSNHIIVIPETLTLSKDNSGMNQIIKDVMQFNGKSNEVSNISGKPRNNSKEITKLINDYFENYEDSFHQIHSLFMKCIDAENRISSVEKRLNNQGKIIETELNAYYFDKGLLETGVCRKFGTRDDPFWTMLKLARRGNEEMQVFLLEYMVLTIYRGAINIQTYPDRYLDLRNEAEGYLQKHSHKGVMFATEILANQYSGKLGKNQLLPTNPVLAYYYAYIADIQNTAANGFWERDLLEMYDRLSEKQKSIVDRMTENL